MQEDYTKLLLDYKSIPVHKRTKTFMEICGFPHYENVCSNILQFYLNPTKEHGLQNLVLNSLLHIVDSNFKYDNDFESIEVYREHSTNEVNRIDLLILTDNYVIGIENKIFHHLHNDLKDYRDTVLSFCHNSKKPICIVLSLYEITRNQDIDKIRANNFEAVTYQQLFHNIKKDIGKYLTSSNISYVNFLTDFIKSIENLTSNTMENKALWTFFKNNSESLQELMDSFNEYKNNLYQKIYQLRDMIPPQEFAPSVGKQWIYQNNCLVHDYIISNHKIAIDTTIDMEGWKILIFCRNSESAKFLNSMLKDSNILTKPIYDYETVGRFVYEKFDTDTNLSILADTLINLLSRIENYKKVADLK